MKITLDITELVARGALTPEEAERLKGLAARDTGSLAVNILMGFGTVAVALGGGVLLPTAQTVIVIGALLLAIGIALVVRGMTRWGIFAQICITIGALGVVGGVWYLSDGNFYVGLGLAVGLAVAATLGRSGLLAALAVLQFSVALGSGTAYWGGGYFFWVQQPGQTIVILGVLAIALYLLSLNVPPAYERVAIIASRTAILMINLAFLVGSLFGDRQFGIEASVFSIVWALLLIGVGLWGVRVNRRWVVNVAAIFAGIHFYTQWFEYLGPNPLSILGGGLLLIAFGFALRWVNERVGRQRTAAESQEAAVKPA